MNETNERPLLDWVLRLHPGTPKTRARQWILAGRVSVGEVVIRRPHELLPDPAGALRLHERRAASLDCGDGWRIHVRLTLLHLDGALAVVNKGSGLLSVPAPGGAISALSILADFLAGRLKARDPAPGGRSLPPAYRKLSPQPVHRLDQYTSGVFCLATNSEARTRLIEQLKARTMKREYVAFVDGRPPAMEGSWRHWLELTEDQLRQRVVAEAAARAPGSRALEAITHYEVLAEYARPGGGTITKMRFRLETGRKHQIRVQAARVGLPLIGDRTYHPAYRQPAQGEPPIDFPRQALHAERLSLVHPETAGTILEWHAPLPEDLRHLEAALRAGPPNHAPSGPAYAGTGGGA